LTGEKKAMEENYREKKEGTFGTGRGKALGEGCRKSFKEKRQERRTKKRQVIDGTRGKASSPRSACRLQKKGGITSLHLNPKDQPRAVNTLTTTTNRKEAKGGLHWPLVSQEGERGKLYFSRGRELIV